MSKSKTAKRYAPEFRRQMVELVRKGGTPKDLAREFGCSYWSIKGWVKQADRNAGGGDGGLTALEREELVRLRRENKRLKLEREILGKSCGLVRPGERAQYQALFGFVKANQARYPVRMMCRLLKVSVSGFYASLERPMSAHERADITLTATIHAIHHHSHETYGAPRVHAELADDYDVHVARKRVARLMRAARLKGVQKRRFVRTTVSDPTERWAPDLVERDFTVTRPDVLWVADVTYVSTWAGFLYLAVVVDAFSRRIVGWAMADHLRTELVLAALEMAYAQRHPRKVIHHSDHGTQYTSIAFGRRCREMGVRPSMGSVGDCFDNAMAESVFASLECEVLDRRHFRTREEARTALFTWIEGWYNPHRRHSSLGYLSPANFERRQMRRSVTTNAVIH
ncbi:MAG: IS3 family transposase [Steroidobacteraceae bacterium]